MSLILSLKLANELITSPGPEVTKRLFADAPGVFWIDWREADEEVVALAAKAMNDPTLTAERSGARLTVSYRGTTAKVPPRSKGDERDLTLLAINKVLAPEHEVRFVRASEGGDTLAFMSLPVEVWQGYEKKFGDRVAAAFARLSGAKPLFRGEQPAPARGVKGSDTPARLTKFSRVHPRLSTIAQARQLKKALRDPVIEPLAGDLVVTYFIDVEPDWPLVTDSLLAEYGLDREQLAKLAYGNALKAWVHVKMIERDGLTEMAGGPEVGGFSMTASIALNPGTWKLTEQFDGPFVAAFPSHERAFSAPLKAPAAVETLRRELAAVDFKAPGALSPQLFAREAGIWKPYED